MDSKKVKNFQQKSQEQASSTAQTWQGSTRTCPTCQGTGINPVVNTMVCPKCNGERVVSGSYNPYTYPWPYIPYPYKNPFTWWWYSPPYISRATYE